LESSIFETEKKNAVSFSQIQYAFLKLDHVCIQESRPSAVRATLYSSPYHQWKTAAGIQAFTRRTSHIHWHLHKQERRTAARGTGHAEGGCAICEYDITDGSLYLSSKQ